jgi:hypothetical protein
MTQHTHYADHAAAWSLPSHTALTGFLSLFHADRRPNWAEKHLKVSWNLILSQYAPGQ